VVHVPEILMVSDGASVADGWGYENAVRLASVGTVLGEHLAATGGGVVDAVGQNGVHQTRRLVQGEPLVSIVIPTRGDTASVRGADRCMVVEAVRSVVELSTYTNVELVVVVDTVAPDHVRDQLREIGGDRLRLIEWDKPFSFSGKMNFGALHAHGEFLLMLNDDVEVITPRWIEPMLALAQLPHAGFAGAMLYFEDETIQHAGHAYYRGDVTHIGLNSERGATGPWGAFELEREVAGVTGACAMIRRSVFIEVGGFSPLLPGNFNDVDFLPDPRHRRALDGGAGGLS
jgi:glycosyltransferase involved in cell wall biosynthesis